VIWLPDDWDFSIVDQEEFPYFGKMSPLRQRMMGHASVGWVITPKNPTFGRHSKDFAAFQAITRYGHAGGAARYQLIWRTLGSPYRPSTRAYWRCGSFGHDLRAGRMGPQRVMSDAAFIAAGIDRL
jgi:hypothetical protein